MRPNAARRDCSRGPNHALMRGCSCSATIAATAANDSWKLGPASDSGKSSSTTSAPVATSRSVIASRPMARAIRISNAAMQDRMVGTSAPVSNV